MRRATTTIGFAVCLLICSLWTGCGRAQSAAEYSKEDRALRAEIGQLLMVGFRGTEINDTMHIVRDIKDYHIGGVILFEYDVPSQSRPRNISSRKQLTKLCHDLQRQSETTLLIGIDQEGGKVNRLKEHYGFPPFLSAQQMAKEGNQSVRRQAALTAKTLQQAGINVDFAPCVDVNVNPDCPIIGKLGRSFGSDARRVSECASLWVNELQRCGVAACLKHFPGHGSSQEDTHQGVADVSDSWSDIELEPYRRLIADNEVLMIMTTHVFNAQIDSVYPATLSKATLSGLLRDSLHYEGVIITDDLAMGAMTKVYSYEEMLLRSLEAGADMLCISNNGSQYQRDIVPQTVDLIFRLVKEGRLDESRIHESAARVEQLKKRLSAR